MGSRKIKNTTFRPIRQRYKPLWVCDLFCFDTLTLTTKTKEIQREKVELLQVTFRLFFHVRR